jgi:hypothetical protein
VRRHSERVHTDPASPAQRELAADLGVELPLGCTVEEASELISFAPAIAKQYLQAAEVGLELPEQATFSEAKRLLAAAYTRAGRRVVAKMQIKVGDILLKDGVLWEVKNIFKGYRLSLKPAYPERCGRKVLMVSTGEPGKVFNAFTFRSAVKVDPQTIEF